MQLSILLFIRVFILLCFVIGLHFLLHTVCVCVRVCVCDDVFVILKSNVIHDIEISQHQMQLNLLNIK